MSVQGTMKELQMLKQEELALVNLASKISDQLNRLKVEELALQNAVRRQNEELERKSRGSQRSINRSLPIEELSKEGNSDEEMGDYSAEKVDNVVPVDLHVNIYNKVYSAMEEEEEEEEEENEMVVHEDIEQYLEHLEK